MNRYTSRVNVISQLLQGIPPCICFLLASTLVKAQDADGEKIFNENCTSCHAINDKVVGPALKDVDKRHDEAWLLKWIRNSQALVKSGDVKAGTTV